ncbi:MAG: RsmD family RNA methyltransferase, partial [Salinisphaeraceae bacterium]|nr:RsmD family RNA methyltransferase [Salinisphaeraceae bacterium]
NLQLLQAEAQTVHTDAVAYLQRDCAQYDIAFVDPPFGQGLAENVLQALAPRLSVCNRVYLECERSLKLAVPTGWEVLKAKRAGEVSYHLLTYQIT